MYKLNIGRQCKRKTVNELRDFIYETIIDELKENIKQLLFNETSEKIGFTIVGN